MMGMVATAAVGLIAGLAAAGLMSLYQAATASLFGQDDQSHDPANVRAADDASKATRHRPIQRETTRQRAGSVVHYATGAALGIGYALLVAHWPPAAWLFGAAFGLAVAIALDDLLVPAFGWGPWPWATPLKTHLYGLSAHVVFGVALEAVRRLGLVVLG